MVFFQFVFAAITVVLLAGAVLARMNFRAWMIFVPLWLTFSYTIGKLQPSSHYSFFISDTLLQARTVFGAAAGPSSAASSTTLAVTSFTSLPAPPASWRHTGLALASSTTERTSSRTMSCSPSSALASSGSAGMVSTEVIRTPLRLMPVPPCSTRTWRLPSACSSGPRWISFSSRSRLSLELCRA